MHSLLHVIVAEDEPLVAATVGGILEESGYRVTLTGDGLEALEADQCDPADLLVTDLRMPRLDGVALVGRIRERRPHLPIIVMTGYSEAIPAEEAGRLVVIRKPFWGDQVNRALEAVLSAATPRPLTSSPS